MRICGTMQRPKAMRAWSARQQIGWLLALCVLVASGCQSKGAPDAAPKSRSESVTEKKRFLFTDVAKQAGVEWVQQNGESASHYSMLESFGSGCAIDDFDRDGLLDLYFAGGGKFGEDNAILPVPIALYRQVADWSFRMVTEDAGLTPSRHYQHGVWSADMNEDGFGDILLTGWGGLQLFQNQGDGTFRDVTETSLLNDNLWSLAAAWVDLNGDQILDLFVGHYVDWSFANHPRCKDPRTSRRTICDPPTFHGLPCRVYVANGDGTFRDGGKELGISGIGKTLGIVTVDLNNDSRPEIYVANDTLPNQLYESQPDGTYRESAIENGVALGETGASDGSMGVDVADLNNDGLFDLWVANYENQTFALYRNLGHNFFMHSSRAMGVTAVGAEAVGFGTVAFDADLDGYTDIFCANGHIWPPDAPGDRRQLPYLFENDGGRRFKNVAPSSGIYLQERHLGRGAATADLNRDGSPDLVVTHTNEPVAILRNDSAGKNWISIQLIGTASPRSGIGAVAEVISGGIRQKSVVKGGGSYLSTSDRTLVFGLGAAEIAETVIINWPSGGETRLKAVPAGTRLVAKEGAKTEFD